jgi:hypothetical protein
MMTTGRAIALALLLCEARAFNFASSPRCVRPSLLPLRAGGSASDLATLAVPDLKAKCRELGLKVSTLAH